MIDLDILRNAFKIDPSTPLKRGRMCDFYMLTSGGPIAVYRYWYHDLFKNGKPKKMRKRK